MNECKPFKRQRIRSAGRSRVIVPLAVLRRVPQRGIPRGLDSALKLAEGDVDGIRQPGDQELPWFPGHEVSEAGTARLLP